MPKIGGFNITQNREGNYVVSNEVGVVIGRIYQQRLTFWASTQRQQHGSLPEAITAVIEEHKARLSGKPERGQDG